jgi:anaerobic ribonucleoside-triphosphate reductase activating protein
MNYASIRDMDISNGLGIGISLFVQGCHFHCKNCFNKETWDFNGGKEWNEEIENNFIELANKDYIKRISILGGEPLADENVETVLKLINNIKNRYKTKKIWLYTGYNYDALFKLKLVDMTDMDNIEKYYEANTIYDNYRRLAINNIDVLVDGQFVDELKDLRYKFAGSTNQRVIDINKTLKNNKVELLFGE